MTPPADTAIPAGRPHLALRALELLVYDFDALGVRTRVLAAGARFIPWEPPPHWRGERVPITLGDAAPGFDWGRESAEGLFLAWQDFFTGTAPLDAVARTAAPPRGERRLDPFAELDAIAARLRARVAERRPDKRHLLDELLARLPELRRAHAEAAEMELAASGYDNIDSMARYAAEQERRLTEAREVLAACRALAEPVGG